MQMRHQPPVDGERIEEFAVGLHRIDRREPQPRELGHVFQNLLHQRTELGRARKIRAIAGEIDARENHFAIAARAEPAHLSDHLAHGHRARIAAAIRDNAEGAAMIATVLHLHECARQVAALSFSSLPSTNATSGMLAKVSGSVCAAQPVTTMRAAGCSRLSRRMAWRDWRTASAVTAQVLTMRVSERPAACA